jgi:predicted GIY-YIG superfamily endonuclease
VKEFYVYLMTNRSRVVLYTGVTSKLGERVWEHKNHVVKGFRQNTSSTASFITNNSLTPFRQSRAKKKLKAGGAKRKMNWYES